MYTQKRIGQREGSGASSEVPSPVNVQEIVEILLVAAVLVLFTAATLHRNIVWNTKLSLWADVAEKSPWKSRAHNNLGNCNMLLGNPFKAIEEYKVAIALDEGNIEAYYNLGVNFENVGIIKQAAYYYEIFCKIAPPSYDEQKKFSCERGRSLSGRVQKTGK